MISLLAFLLVITVVVFFHELGHWAAARLAGVRVDELSIGFGKELFGFERLKTRWKVSILPLGGYVKIHGLEEKSTDKDALCNKSPLTNIWVFAAGPLANLLFAWLMFTGLFLAVGSPTTGNQIGEVIEGSPAAVAGLEAGDRILSINEIPVERFEQAGQILGDSQGKAQVEILRGDKQLTFRITPKEENGGRILGIISAPPEYKKSAAGTAVLDAMVFTYRQSAMVVTALGGIFSGSSIENLGGPIQIARISGNVWQGGALAFCFFLAFISINLGLINLLPIPPLDGGRIILQALEPLFKGRQEIFKRLSRLGMMLGLFLVLLLLVIATWNDILRILSA